MGVALGNIITGIPLAQNKEFTGSFIGLLNPFALTGRNNDCSLFMMHGAIYLVMKTVGELQKQVRGWVNNTIIFFVICFVTSTMATLIYYPHMVIHFKEIPVLFLIAILNMLAIANIPREIYKGNEFKAFLSSTASIALLLMTFCDWYFSKSCTLKSEP